MSKARIEMTTTLENKKELQEKASKLGLTLSVYLVLKGLDKLKENK